MAQVRIYSTPMYLYRYRKLTDDTLEREVSALTKATIYCPSFSDMNDPMEGAHRPSLGIVLRGSHDAQKGVSEARDQLGIASLSEVHDHEPMWAHYAGQFSGMCIMFSTRKLLAGLDDSIDLIRMAYNEKPPSLAPGKGSTVDRAKLTLATKTVRWASEREWRLISPSIGIAEYGDQRAAIRVYLGSRIDKDHENCLRRELRQLRIPVAKMKIDKYTIEFSGAG